MGKVFIVVATIIAVVLAGYFIAVRVNPALAGGDVAPVSVEGEDEEADTSTAPTDELGGTATISGVITPLSSGGGDGFYLLRVTGKGHLPIHIDDALGMPALGQSIVVAVPDDFVSSSDDEEQFDALRELADSSGGALEVLEYTD